MCGYLYKRKFGKCFRFNKKENEFEVIDEESFFFKQKRK